MQVCKWQPYTILLFVTFAIAGNNSHFTLKCVLLWTVVSMLLTLVSSDRLTCLWSVTMLARVWPWRTFHFADMVWLGDRRLAPLRYLSLFLAISVPAINSQSHTAPYSIYTITLSAASSRVCMPQSNAIPTSFQYLPFPTDTVHKQDYCTVLCICNHKVTLRNTFLNLLTLLFQLLQMFG